MHPLVGPIAKVERAQSQIGGLNDSFKRFFQLNPYRVSIAEFDHKQGHYALRVSPECPELPIEWSVIVGEIVHDLRSALDGITWQLAMCSLGHTEPDKVTQFPICTHGKSKRTRPNQFWTWSKGQWCVNPHIAKIDRRFWAHIESFQPYKRGHEGRHNRLFLLGQLNDTDKHKLIPVLQVYFGGLHLTGRWGRSHVKVGMPLYPNAKVWYVTPLSKEGAQVLDFTSGTPKIRIEHNVQVDSRITPGVFFGDGCDPVKRLPVINTLVSISHEVLRVIKSFAGDF